MVLPVNRRLTQVTKRIHSGTTGNPSLYAVQRGLHSRPGTMPYCTQMMLHCMSTGTGECMPGTYVPGEQLMLDPLPWKNYIFIYVFTTWDIPQPENLPKKAIFLPGLRPDGTSHTLSGDPPHLPKTVIFSSPPTAGWGAPLPHRNGGTSHPNGLSTKENGR